MIMEFAIRVDSSVEMGSGHVMRCLTLANMVRQQGHMVYFICRRLPGNLINVIEDKGYMVYQMPYAPYSHIATLEELRHTHWLGTVWEIDAQETIGIISSRKQAADWVIVDHYAIDYRWESLLRPHVGKIMVIDDLSDRQHNCDLILDQNLHEDRNSKYKQLIPESCMQLLGTSYVLLRSEFSDAKKNMHQRTGTLRRIFVFFGGSDPTNETWKALQAIDSLRYTDIIVDVVVGASNPHKEQIEKFCLTHAKYHFYCQINNIAQLMAKADLAIGAGGTATWERCYLGLPAITISFAHNQEAIAKLAAQAGASIYLGIASDVEVAKIAGTIKQVRQQPEQLKQMSIQAMQLVDGLGIWRVIRSMGECKFKVTVVSDGNSWINKYIPQLVTMLKDRGHIVLWVHDVAEIPQGDFVFYVGCGQIVPTSILARNRHNLVIHESAIPQGKGWSPLTWQILEGKNEIPITLFEATEKVDNAMIYLTDTMLFKGTELVDELRSAQAAKSVELFLKFIDSYPDVVSQGRQPQGESSYYRRRMPVNSRLDIDKTIAEQFHLLRVVDNEQYPAYFEINGEVYKLKIYKD
jgi:UDP-2,4-diacetamido-2,4,6-trideoxy-beta-L-altropyranose hydrolase